MKLKTVIYFTILGVGLGWLSGYVFGETGVQDGPLRHFNLLAPEHNMEFDDGPVTFSWEPGGMHEGSESTIIRYEIRFWSAIRDFGKIFTVAPNDSADDVVSLKLENFRRVFRRHGRYYWRVTAFTDNGESTSTEIRSFNVGVPKVYKGFSPWNYLYAVTFEYIDRQKTAEYAAFLNNIHPTANLRSYSDIGITFRQDRTLVPFLDMKEKFMLLSQIGLGWEFNMRFHAFQTLYLSFYPYGSVSSSWFSLGLEDYSSTAFSVKVGCEMEVMPRSLMTFFGSWVPAYNIRYTEKGGGLRTFEGDGWEIGLRIIISHAILSTFRLFGIEVDFERMPFELHVGEIRDQYTGTLMKMKRINVGILLQ